MTDCSTNRLPHFLLSGLFCALGLPGCGGDARVELAAADALDAAAVELKAALNEYTAELHFADRNRRDAAIGAFADRLRRDIADDDVVQAHTAAFRQALNALNADSRTEWQRYDTTRGNIEALEEIAVGLRRVGIATMTVRDDVRRYLGTLIEARSQAQQTQGENR